MKKLLFTFVILLTFQIANAQYLIIGDTTGYEVTEIEETFYPDSEVLFDMDCDGIQDIRFNSQLSEGVPMGMCSFIQRIRTHFDMSLVKARCSPSSGFIEPFELNDTMSYDGLWYELYSGIYDACQSQGLIQSDSVFLIFRKIENNDTLYIQIKFSNNREVFTIHKIISECSNPFQIITRGINQDTVTVVDTSIVDTSFIDTTTLIIIPDETIVYPNPFKTKIQLNIDIENIKQVNLYDNTGRLLHQSLNNNHLENLDFLPIGVYFIEIVDYSDKRMIERVLKIDDY